MLKTILIFLVFIIVIILVAYAFTLFFVPTQLHRYDTCVLLQNENTEEIDCFGCTNNICKDAPLEWKPAENITKHKCLDTPQGCQFSQ